MCYVGQPAVPGRPSRPGISVQFIWYEGLWYQSFLFDTNSGQQALLAMIGTFVLLPLYQLQRKVYLVATRCHLIFLILRYCFDAQTLLKFQIGCWIKNFPMTALSPSIYLLILPVFYWFETGLPWTFSYVSSPIVISVTKGSRFEILDGINGVILCSLNIVNKTNDAGPAVAKLNLAF